MAYWYKFPSNLGSSSATLRDWSEFKQWLHGYSTMQPNWTAENPEIGIKRGSVLMHLGGQEISELLKGTSHENNADVLDETDLVKQLEKIEDLVFPKFLVLFQRFQFFVCKQKENDKMCSYLSKLHWLSESCEFEAEKEKHMKGQIIKGILNDKLRHQLKQKETLDGRNIEEICRKTDPCCKGLCLCCNTLENESESRQSFIDLGLERGFIKAVEYQEAADLNDILDSVNSSSEGRNSTFSCDGKQNINNLEPEHFTSELPTSQERPDLVLPQSPTDNFVQTDTVKGTTTLESFHLLSEVDQYDEIESAEKDEDDETIDMYDREIQINFMKAEKIDLAVDLKGNEGKDEELMKSIQQQNVYILDDIVNAVVEVPEPKFYFNYKIPVSVVSSETTMTTNTNLKCADSGDAKQSWSSQTETSTTSTSSDNATCSLNSANSIRTYLSSHYKKRKGKEQMFTCQFCDKSFYNSWSCYHHVRENHPEMAPYKCDQCNKSFMLQTSLDEHKLIHTEDQMATCPECSAKFESARSLEKHQLKEHKKDKYACSFCDQTFRFLSLLELHEMKHKGERPFVCEICGSSHRVRAQLKYHMKTHGPEPPFKCPHCAKTFNFKANLNTHLARHLGKKKYVCHICGLATSKALDLTYHLRTHTGERPYECPTCNKTFTRPNHFTRHKRIHTGEKLYSCHICGSKFTRMTNVRSHQRSIHGLDIPDVPSRRVKIINTDVSLNQ